MHDVGPAWHPTARSVFLLAGVLGADAGVAIGQGRPLPPAPVVQQVRASGEGVPVIVTGTLAAAVPAAGWLTVETERLADGAWIRDDDGGEDGVPLGEWGSSLNTTKTGPPMEIVAVVDTRGCLWRPGKHRVRFGLVTGELTETVRGVRHVVVNGEWVEFHVAARPQVEALVRRALRDGSDIFRKVPGATNRLCVVQALYANAWSPVARNCGPMTLDLQDHMDELQALARDGSLDPQWRQYVALRGLEFARNIAEGCQDKAADMLARSSELLGIAKGIPGSMEWALAWEEMRIDNLLGVLTPARLEALRDAPGCWQCAVPWIEQRLTRLAAGRPERTAVGQ